MIMFGHHVAVQYNKIELEFAVGGIGEGFFFKSGLFKRGEMI